MTFQQRIARMMAATLVVAGAWASSGCAVGVTDDGDSELADAAADWNADAELPAEQADTPDATVVAYDRHHHEASSAAERTETEDASFALLGDNVEGGGDDEGEGENEDNPDPTPWVLNPDPTPWHPNGGDNSSSSQSDPDPQPWQD
jgi:hypothetical protein